MKRMGMTAAAVALLFAFLLFCVGALVRYARPMNDASYDLSLAWAGEAMPSDWVYDQKGWRVFTMEGGERRELTANGFGGFYGDVEPDETFYYARARLPRQWTRPLCRSTPTTAPSPSIWTGNASISTWPRTRASAKWNSRSWAGRAARPCW